MNDKDRRIIKKMVQYCEDISSLLEQFHHSFKEYETHIAFQYSCNMCIIQIGELVSRLSSDAVESNPQIPWIAIEGMRNLHAHDYENVDFEIVWNTLNDEIPELKEELEKII